MTEEVQTFYGPWELRVDTKDAWFEQQLVIVGSDSSDGEYPGVPGTAITVSGDSWQLTMNWRDPAGGPWAPSRIRRSAAYTPSGGLVLGLGADDSPPEVADRDFDDMTVTATSQDPDLDPLQPWENPYNFTLPENAFVEEG